MTDGSLPPVTRNRALTGDVVLSSRDYVFVRRSATTSKNEGGTFIIAYTRSFE